MDKVPEGPRGSRVSIQKASKETRRQSAATTTSIGDDNEYDNHFFHGVVEDAGRWAFGVVFAEVWVMNSTKTHLFRPNQGWWMDPYSNDLGENHCFDRLIDSSRDDFLPPNPLAPGCGLPGALYAELRIGNMANRASALSGDIRDEDNDDMVDAESGRIGSMPFASSMRSTSRRFVGGGNLLASRVIWRDVQAIANDPDQPFNPRLKFMAEAGLGWAAGIPFKVGSSEGLVIYMARQNVNMQQLADPVNSNYLIHATLLIGSAYALRVPRRLAEEAHKEHMHATLHRVKLKISALTKMEKTLESFVHEESSRPFTPNKTSGGYPNRHSVVYDTHQSVNMVARWFQIARDRLWCTLQKCRGANLKAPPTFTWEQTAWTFGGAFITLLILTKLNERLVENHGRDYSIVLGPFGALMTLQYGLTAAPASQPRNAILGQTCSLLIAHAIGQTKMEPWFQQSLATSLAIATMVKMGITHPPAGAAALLFSTGARTWSQVGMMLVANVIAILTATWINNLCEQRQYPTFWGLIELNDYVFADRRKDASQDTKNE